MPPKPRYADMWWEEMPEKAHAAAFVMGYDASTWDADAKIDYDRKPFHETTLDERRAAMYLGLNPIDKKLNISYCDTDTETKTQAAVIGWDQEKWDHDWNIRDFPIEHLYWKDLNETQKAAAVYFGYCKCTWDESGDDEELDFKVVSVFRSLYWLQINIFVGIFYLCFHGHKSNKFFDGICKYSLQHKEKRAPHLLLQRSMLKKRKKRSTQRNRKQLLMLP
jgi:hypothetical protein